MTGLTIPLRPRTAYGPEWFRVTQIICGIIFIAQGVVYSGTSYWFPRFAIAYGLALMLAMIILPRLTRQYSITIDDRGIRGRISYSSLIDVPWEDLARAEIKMFALILRTKDKQIYHIDFGELTYDQHKAVKPVLMDALRSGGLLKESA